MDFLPQQQQRQALVGRLVSDVKQTVTEEGQPVAYFVFGDLSARAAGRYRLRFVLAAAYVYNTLLGTRLMIVE